jgi:hypothetical protein
LREDLADAEHDAGTAADVVEKRPLTRRVFVVHGHDYGVREGVASF